MAFCGKCGAQLEENSKFCSVCGTAAGTPGAQSGARPGADFGAALEKIQKTADHTEQFSPDDIAKNRGMAILAYLGFLVVIPIFAAKESPFARYHSNQGLLLLIAEFAYGIAVRIITSILYAIWWGLGSIFSLIFGVLSLAFLALLISGIVNAANGKAKELPVIGQFTILK